MCVSNNAIELQAYHFAEEIQKSSKYNLVRVYFLGDTFLECSQAVSLRNSLAGYENLPLIKNLILQDKDGKKFSVEPDELGLSFAKGELSYGQYLKMKAGDHRKFVAITLGFTGFFTIAAGSIIVYFL